MCLTPFRKRRHTIRDLSFRGRLPIPGVMDGIAGVEARIAEIQSMFGAPATSVAATTTSTATGTGSTDFQAALDGAQATTATSSTTATSAVSSSGGGSREQWARDFLSSLNLPQ